MCSTPTATLSAALSWTLNAQLYETSAGDPLTFLGVIAVLSTVAVLATYIPARRAAQIAPVEALRSQ